MNGVKYLSGKIEAQSIGDEIFRADSLRLHTLLVIHRSTFVSLSVGWRNGGRLELEPGKPSAAEHLHPNSRSWGLSRVILGRAATHEALRAATTSSSASTQGEGTTSPLGMGLLSSEGTPQRDPFSAAEWAGWECKFSGRDGSRQAVPEDYVPESLSEWGVEVSREARRSGHTRQAVQLLRPSFPVFDALHVVVRPLFVVVLCYMFQVYYYDTQVLFRSVLFCSVSSRFVSSHVFPGVGETLDEGHGDRASLASHLSVCLSLTSAVPSSASVCFER